MLRRAARISAAFCLIGALCSCGACDDDAAPRVPFGLGEAATSPGDGHALPASRAEPLLFREPVAEAELAGAALRLAEGGIRALLLADLDHDGVDEAIVVAAAAAGGLGLSTSRRSETGWAPVRSVEALFTPAGDTCAIGDVALEWLGADLIQITAGRTCEPGGTERRLWVVSLDRAPDAVVALGLLPPREGEPPWSLSLRVKGIDRDGDSRTDVEVTVALGLGTELPEGPAVTLAWMDRPGGLTRDTSEPARSLEQLVQTAIAAEPGPALEAAERTLAAHAVLCRAEGTDETPRARLVVDGVVGLPCAGRAQLGTASAIKVLSLLRLDRARDAITAYLALEGEVKRAADRLLAEQRSAIPASPGWALVRGPALSQPSAGPTAPFHLVDGETVIIHGDPTMRYRHEPSGAWVQVGPDEPWRGHRDPSGTLALAGVRADCRGLIGSIVRVTATGPPTPIAEPLLAPSAASAPCTPATANDGGALVLGWAPQGIVTARGTEIFVASITVRGEPDGAPHALAPGQAPPAPLAPGYATRDARYYVIATPFGIVRRAPSSDELTWLRPAAMRLDPAIAHAVVAPTGDVAYLQDNTIWVLTSGDGVR